MLGWFPPDLAVEFPELQRVSLEKGIPLSQLRDAFPKGHRMQVSDWSVFDNTDAVDDLTEEEARLRAQEYGRDIDRIFRGLDVGAEIPMPCVMPWEGSLHVIGGNTRMMACRVRGIFPEVWVVTLRSSRPDLNRDF